MCLIVDANVAARVFGEADDPEIQPVRDWLFSSKQRSKLVIGGKLRAELLQIERVRQAVFQLGRAGRIRDIDDQEVDAEAATVEAGGLLQSNDSHVIALARTSGSRLLCSEDHALHDDFKNKKLVDPKGKIYQNSSHRRLLTARDACPA